jgi:hypothetical protein
VAETAVDEHSFLVELPRRRRDRIIRFAGVIFFNYDESDAT